ncbi:hypothetical protein [Actinomadura verrucosospora]|uniref:Uncharacterized protein n=1 Tax=Actinomadura verrucosospora TaxID=46165 RepID=A0A7D4A961_ACTVE|nr:hypothetical protein [Actinomadura verrucosospora]QKG25545.1 hypothetical protein ACTIVE_7197 [Actinomadura verrucosospora]
MEWTPRQRDHKALGAFLTLCVIGAIYLAIANRGFAWVLDWRMSALLFALSGLGALFGLIEWRIDCGADWLRHAWRWVKLYELTEIEVVKAQELRLKDRGEREVKIELKEFGKNQELWDLVYNGIQHSYHYGGATADSGTRLSLSLYKPVLVPLTGFEDESEIVEHDVDAAVRDFLAWEPDSPEDRARMRKREAELREAWWPGGGDEEPPPGG